jgi:hypothetical protein
MPAQNGFADPDGLGAAPYGGQTLVPDFTYTPRNWYRFEYDLDFDAHTITNFNIYDLDAQISDPVATNQQVFFFRNDNTNYFGPLGSFGAGLDIALANEGFNLDNIAISAIPEPTLPAGALILSLVALRRRRA